jgi:hypothetical protein
MGNKISDIIIGILLYPIAQHKAKGKSNGYMKKNTLSLTLTSLTWLKKASILQKGNVNIMGAILES